MLYAEISLYSPKACSVTLPPFQKKKMSALDSKYSYTYLNLDINAAAEYYTCKYT
jgi:hypothetical protein